MASVVFKLLRFCIDIGAMFIFMKVMTINYTTTDNFIRKNIKII